MKREKTLQLTPDQEKLFKEREEWALKIASKWSDRNNINEDLKPAIASAALVGLADWCTRFDPARGLAFSTGGIPRILGEMKDELRRHDHVSRNTRIAIKAGEKENVVLVSGHAGEADKLGFFDLQHAPQPECEVEKSEELRQALSLIPAGQGRQVCEMYYVEGLKLHEIGDRLGLTESRIAQIHTRALEHARRMAAGREAENGITPPPAISKPSTFALEKNLCPCPKCGGSMKNSRFKVCLKCAAKARRQDGGGNSAPSDDRIGVADE